MTSGQSVTTSPQDHDTVINRSSLLAICRLKEPHEWPTSQFCRELTCRSSGLENVMRSEVIDATCYHRQGVVVSHDYVIMRIRLSDDDVDLGEMWLRCERRPGQFSHTSLLLSSVSPPAGDTVTMSFNRSLLTQEDDQPIMQIPCTTLCLIHIVRLFQIISEVSKNYSVASYNCWWFAAVVVGSLQPFGQGWTIPPSPRWQKSAITMLGRKTKDSTNQINQKFRAAWENEIVEQAGISSQSLSPPPLDGSSGTQLRVRLRSPSAPVVTVPGSPRYPRPDSLLPPGSSGGSTLTVSSLTSPTPSSEQGLWPNSVIVADLIHNFEQTTPAAENVHERLSKLYSEPVHPHSSSALDAVQFQESPRQGPRTLGEDGPPSPSSPRSPRTESPRSPTRRKSSLLQSLTRTLSGLGIRIPPAPASVSEPGSTLLNQWTPPHVGFMDLIPDSVSDLYTLLKHVVLESNPDSESASILLTVYSAFVSGEELLKLVRELFVQARDNDEKERISRLAQRWATFPYRDESIFPSLYVWLHTKSAGLNLEPSIPRNSLVSFANIGGQAWGMAFQQLSEKELKHLALRLRYQEVQYRASLTPSVIFRKFCENEEFQSSREVACWVVDLFLQTGIDYRARNISTARDIYSALSSAFVTDLRHTLIHAGQETGILALGRAIYGIPDTMYPDYSPQAPMYPIHSYRERLLGSYRMIRSEDSISWLACKQLYIALQTLVPPTSSVPADVTFEAIGIEDIRQAVGRENGFSARSVNLMLVDEQNYCDTIRRVY